MVEQKQFSGQLNTDDSNEVLAPHQHKDARNVVFRNGRVENIQGTTLILNSFLPGGQNVCLGSFYDSVRLRIYWFNYGSLHEGLYYYDIVAQTISYVILGGTNADDGVLNLDRRYPIHSINIIYGDEILGDTIYWLNSQKLPCRINVNQAIAGTYGTITRSFITVAKEPPDIPPQVVYEDDSTVTVNNMRKKLFKFKTRFVYENNDKSVWSAHSKVPVPLFYAQTEIDADPSKNADIAIAFQTGQTTVKKIEIAGAVGEGNVFGDFFLITVIDKDAQSIPSNDTSIFRFYNNEGYIPLDLTESIQRFDYVPQGANAQELLNGNVVVYGGITEGYDNITDFTNDDGDTTNLTDELVVSQKSETPSILFPTQASKSAAGTGDIHVIVLGTIHIADHFEIYTDAGTIIANSTAGTTTNMITAIGAAAVILGFTITSSDANNIYLRKTNAKLLGYSILYSDTGYVQTDSVPAYDWNSTYGIGMVYFDKYGITNGVVYPANFSTQTDSIVESGIMGMDEIPQLDIEIYHRAPIWAYYFQFVRTLNKTKSKFVQWVSDRTFKDNAPEDNGLTYAYISIESLNTFVLENKNSPLGYSFSPNDRIRFMKLFNQSGSTNQVYGNNKDYEIQDSVTSPIINGTTYTGQFLKILLPTTSGTFDFGTPDFFYYQIELYTPAKPVGGNLEFYYEFGERYAILDPTTTQQSHQGQTQNQSFDLSTPALFSFTLGDDWYRKKTVNAGAELDYQVVPGDIDDGKLTVGVNFSSATYTDPNVTTGNSPLQNLVGFDLATNNDRWLIKIGTGTYTFRIKGSITVNFNLADASYSVYLQKNDGTIITLVPYQYFTAGANSFAVDATFSMTTGEKIFIFGISATDFDDTRRWAQTELKITRQLQFTSGFIDPNFSDYYASALNSNGRAWEYDPNAGRNFFGNMLRWGLAYEPDTNINKTNRFLPLDFTTADLSFGDIQRFKTRDRILRVFQNRKVGQFGVYARFIQNNNGTPSLVTTDEIITSNNINYYEGNYGMGDRPESLTSSDDADWFVDPVLGEEIRLASNGLLSISKLYYGKYYIKSLLTPYNKAWTRPDGSKAFIIKFYDTLEKQCVTILQSGTNGDDSIENYTYSFNALRNGFWGFYDIFPQWATCAVDKNYFWSDGNLYIQNNTTTYCNFFNVQYQPSITVVFNDKVNIKKTFNATSYQGNQIWVSPTNGDIITSQINDQTLMAQISSLIESDYDLQEWLRYAALLRDANSSDDPILALLEGDVLKGVWLQVKYTYQGTDFAYLYLPTCNFSISNRNF